MKNRILSAAVAAAALIAVPAVAQVDNSRPGSVNQQREDGENPPFPVAIALAAAAVVVATILIVADNDDDIDPPVSA